MVGFERGKVKRVEKVSVVESDKEGLRIDKKMTRVIFCFL